MKTNLCRELRTMNYKFFCHGIADVSMRQTGAGVHRNTTWLRIKTIYLLSSWVVAGTILIVLGVGRTEQGGLLCCGSHVAHVVPAFRTKLSTASSDDVQFSCHRLCYRLFLIRWSGGD